MLHAFPAGDALAAAIRQFRQMAQLTSSSSVSEQLPSRPIPVDQPNVTLEQRHVDGKREVPLLLLLVLLLVLLPKLVAPQAICQGHRCAAGLWWAWHN